jgi:hypothetical protein
VKSTDLYRRTKKLNKGFLKMKSYSYESTKLSKTYSVP